MDIPLDPDNGGFIRPGRFGSGGGTPGTGSGAGGGFGGSSGGGGGGFVGYGGGYSGQPGGSWARKLRYGQPAPSFPSGGLNTNPTSTGGPYTGGSDYQPFPGMSNLPGQGQGQNGWADAWGGITGHGDQTGWSAVDVARFLTGQAGGAGVFDPYGSQGLLQMQRQNMISSMGAQEAGAVNAARSMYGDDPQMAAYAALQSRLGGQRAMATSLANTQTQSALQNQDFLQQLMTSLFGSDSDWYARERAAQLAK